MASSAQKELVRIASDSVQMEGMLELPVDPIGIVLFAHGSGSSRFSPRNNYVAGELRAAGIGTLLLDLLTAEEDEAYRTRFNISLLTKRLNDAADWLQKNYGTQSLPLGLFGASTGAAAAVQVAAIRKQNVTAVVSRGGRPDLAGRSALAAVQAPTLLIVGGADAVVLDLNQQAYADLQCEKQLEIVPGATHLFAEIGALESVASLASSWFRSHMSEPDPAMDDAYMNANANRSHGNSSKTGAP